MSRTLWTMGLVIASMVAYQIGQKSVPKTASPFFVLAAAYGVACTLCIAFLTLRGQVPTRDDVRASLSWPTWVIALAIFGIEVGFLLAYRSGWTISIAYGVSSAATVLLLAVVGALVFGEPLGSRRLLGLALACVSLWLIATGGQTTR
jgi:drug/metabolite transporter (DMT)-like permease